MRSTTNKQPYKKEVIKINCTSLVLFLLEQGGLSAQQILPSAYRYTSLFNLLRLATSHVYLGTMLMSFGLVDTYKEGKSRSFISGFNTAFLVLATACFNGAVTSLLETNLLSSESESDRELSTADYVFGFVVGFSAAIFPIVTRSFRPFIRYSFRPAIEALDIKEKRYFGIVSSKKVAFFALYAIVPVTISFISSYALIKIFSLLNYSEEYGVYYPRDLKKVIATLQIIDDNSVPILAFARDFSMILSLISAWFINSYLQYQQRPLDKFLNISDESSSTLRFLIRLPFVITAAYVTQKITLYAWRKLYPQKLQKIDKLSLDVPYFAEPNADRLYITSMFTGVGMVGLTAIARRYGRIAAVLGGGFGSAIGYFAGHKLSEVLRLTSSKKINHHEINQFEKLLEKSEIEINIWLPEGTIHKRFLTNPGHVSLRTRKIYASVWPRLDFNTGLDVTLQKYTHNMILSKGKPKFTNKERGIYLYRAGIPEQIFALVVHGRTKNHALNLSEICRESEQEELLRELKWEEYSYEDKESIRTEFSIELVNLISLNCEQVHLQGLCFFDDINIDKYNLSRDIQMRSPDEKELILSSDVDVTCINHAFTTLLFMLEQEEIKAEWSPRVTTRDIQLLRSQLLRFLLMNSVSNVEVSTIDSYENSSRYRVFAKSNNASDVGSVYRTLSTRLNDIGLTYLRVPGDGHCLYHAVSYYLEHGEDQNWLRLLVSTHLENNIEEFHDFIDWGDKSVMDYIKEIRSGKEWAANLEIIILMRVLNRPIIILGPKTTILNQIDIEAYINEPPIFVHYDGEGHYDALLKQEGCTDEQILSSIKTSTRLHEPYSEIHDRMSHEWCKPQLSLFGHDEYSDQYWLVTIYNTGKSESSSAFFGHAALLLEGIEKFSNWRDDEDLYNCLPENLINKLDENNGWDKYYHLIARYDLKAEGRTCRIDTFYDDCFPYSVSRSNTDRYQRYQSRTFCKPVSMWRDALYEMIKSIHGDKNQLSDKEFGVEDVLDEGIDFEFRAWWPFKIPFLEHDDDKHPEYINCAKWANQKLSMIGEEQFGKKVNKKPKFAVSGTIKSCTLT